MNTNEEKIQEIPADKFKFVQYDETLHDQKFETEPVGYFKDAFRRFLKNRSSVIGGIVIIILVLFSIFGPVLSKYSVSDRDAYYSYALPKVSALKWAGWNGCRTMTVNQALYDKYTANGAVVKDYGEVENEKSRGKTYKIKVDSYVAVGYVYKTISPDTYEKAKEYEKETGIQLFYPLIDTAEIKAAAYKSDANAWYETDIKGAAVKNYVTGEFRDIYLKDETGNLVYTQEKSNGAKLKVRVLYSEWYKFKHGFYAEFAFGADANGYDIWTRLASGARLSLILSIIVSSIDLVLGTVIGALEGYYGGTFDLIMERIKDFLWEIPDIVLFSLFQMHFASKVGPIPSLLFAFVFFGWIGTSSTTRAQMYRFKGQEYVLAARTLGAKDSRLIFRHILPNGIGYIITASVLYIPSVILSEATLSYLGIVNLQSDSITSIGTMLNNGQTTLSTYPHCVFFPAVFIALLLICFNLFGNGLRDAFNPALRGAEE